MMPEHQPETVGQEPGDTAHAGPSSTTNPEDAQKEARVIEQAATVQALWKLLSCAYHFPAVEPQAPLAQWDYVLREGRWMAEDFMQERLWKQAAAARFSQQAAQFDRSKLRNTATKVTQSVEKEDSEFGKVLPDSRPAYPVDDDPPPSPPPTPITLFDFPVEPYLPPVEGLMERVLQQLEEDDVARLVKHAVAASAYSAAYDNARWMPAHEEEEAAIAAGKRAAQQKRRAKPMALLLPGDSDMLDYLEGSVTASGVPQSGGLTSNKAMRRAANAAVTGGSTLRGAAAMEQALAVDDGLGPGRERRKRKVRDFANDDEDYNVMGNRNPAASRDRLGRFGTRSTTALMERDSVGLGLPEGVPSRRGVGVGPVSTPAVGRPPKSAAAAAAAAAAATGALLPRSGTLPRLDALQRMPSMSARAAGGVGGFDGRGGLSGAMSLGTERLVMWSPLDDNVLAAVVMEFGVNWSLVADVLRSATAMTGQYRRPDMCRVRYNAFQRAAQAEQQRTDISEVPADIPVNMMQPLMSKPQAKEILASSLPVNADVLRTHLDVVAQLAGRNKAKRLQERTAIREAHKYRAEPHASHGKVHTAVLALFNQRVLTPLEIDPTEHPPPPPQPQHSQQQQQPGGPAPLATTPTASGLLSAASLPFVGSPQGPAAAAAAAPAVAAAAAPGPSMMAAATSPAPQQQPGQGRQLDAGAYQASLQQQQQQHIQQQQYQQQAAQALNPNALAAMAAAAAAAATSGKVPGAAAPMPQQQQQQLMQQQHASMQQQQAAAMMAAAMAAANPAGLQHAIGQHGALQQQQQPQPQQQQQQQGLPGVPGGMAQMPTLPPGMTLQQAMAVAMRSSNPALAAQIQQQMQKMQAAAAGSAGQQQQQQQVGQQQQQQQGQQQQMQGQQKMVQQQQQGLKPGQQGIPQGAAGGVPGAAATAMMLPGQAGAARPSLQQQQQQQAAMAAAAAGRFPGMQQSSSTAGAGTSGGLNPALAQMHKQMQQQAAAQAAAAAAAAAAGSPAALQALQAKLASQQQQQRPGMPAMNQAAMLMAAAAQQQQGMQQQQQPGPAPQQLLPNVQGAMQNQALWQQQQAAAGQMAAAQQQQQQHFATQAQQQQGQ